MQWVLNESPHFTTGIIAVTCGSSGDDDQYFGLICAEDGHGDVDYSAAREGWCVKRDLAVAITRGGAQVSTGAQLLWTLPGEVVMVYGCLGAECKVLGWANGR